MAITILENGKISAGSNAQRFVGFDVASQLKPATSQFSETNDGTFTENVITGNLLLKLTGDLDENTKPLFISFVNRAIEKGDYKLVFNPVVTNPDGTKGVMGESEFKRRKRYLLKVLNAHAKTSNWVKTSEDTLKTQVFTNIYNLVLSAQNQIKAQITVDTCTGELKDKAGKTTSGNAEKHVSPDVPSSKMVMQVQNQLGKAVVGIGAVSLKTFFILSTQNNIKAKQVADLISKGKYADAYGLFESMIIKNPLTGKNTTIANTNLRNIKRAIQNAPNFTIGDLSGVKSKEEFLQEVEALEKEIARISAPEFLSGIISLAADNAKDLALPKLNATEDLVDIYTTAAMIGIPFNSKIDEQGNTIIGISDIMTSSIFNFLTAKGENNIFNSYTKGRKVKNMIEVALKSNFNLFPEGRRGLKKLVFDYNSFVSKHIEESKGKGKTDFYAFLNNNEGKWDFGGDFLSDVAKLRDVKKWVLTQVVKSNDQAILKSMYEEDIDPEDMFSNEEGVEQEAPAYWKEKDWYSVYKALEFYEELSTKLGPTDLQMLGSLSQLIKLVGEMSTLGRQGSINQGLKTNISDFYKFEHNLEKLINDEIDPIRHSKNKSLEVLQANIETILGKDQPFKMDRFLTDRNYMENVCALMEHVKVGFNILDALRYSSHFFAMSKLVPVADYVLRSTAFKYDETVNIADKLIGQFKYLNENDFKEIENYLNDLMIFEFLQNNVSLNLKTLAEETKASISTYETDKSLNTTSRETLKLDDAMSIASAKHVIESVLVPFLKSNPKFKDNKFVMDLNASSDKNSMIIFSLPIQMMEADKDGNTRNLYTEYLTGFNELTKNEVGGTYLGDWFFLYNMIVNKNSFGQHALTKIFEDLVDSKNPPEIISEFYKFVGQLDKRAVRISSNIEEVTYRLAKYSKGTKVTSDKRVDLVGDYTLDLPFTANIESNTTLHPITKAEEWRPLKSMSSSEVIKLLANQINSNQPEKIIEVIDNNHELVKSGIKERGFIKDGVVYINTDAFDKNGAADAIAVSMHELAHLVFAGVKAKSPNSGMKQLYYQLLFKASEQSDFAEFTKLYPNVVGSDLAEEYICNKITKLLTNRISEKNEFEVQLNDNKLILAGLTTLFPDIKENEYPDNMSLDQFATTATRNIFSASDQITSVYIENNQKIAAIKKKLFDEGEKIDRNQNGDKNNNLQQDCDFPF